MSNGGDSLDQKKPRKSKVRVTPKTARPRRMRVSSAPPAAGALTSEDAAPVSLAPESLAESLAPESMAESLAPESREPTPETYALEPTPVSGAVSVNDTSRITVPPTIVSIAPASADAPKAPAEKAEKADLDEHHAFFDAPSEERRAAEPPKERTEAEMREARAAVAAMEKRRAKLTKYVRVAVGAAALLCLAAGVRSAIARVRHEREPAVAAAAASPTSKMADRVTSSVALAIDAPSTIPAIPPPPESAAPAEEPQAPVKSALDEKKDARAALEHGKLKDAIAAGERSVTLDPTDGEAWLLLGAAYQDSGHGVDARRCFKECTKQGKTGPIGECRLMLQ